MTVEAVERQAQSAAQHALVAPVGVDAKAWAALVHTASPRASEPLIIVDTATDLEAIRPWLAAGTGVEFAPRGTLVIMELLALSKDHQQFIARRVTEIDSSNELGCVVILHQPIAELVSLKRIDESLARRFAGSEIILPRLNERSEDLRAMILDRVARCGLSLRGEPHAIDDAVLGELLNYDWPGNESELDSTLQLLVQQSAGPLIHLEDLEAIGFLTQADALNHAATEPARSLRPPQRRIGRRAR
jgi:DNA-binding NtrC family response regulator